MPHTLATASNVIHTHATSGYEVTNCNLTHYSTACKPGYPHASIFFFDIGTGAFFHTYGTILTLIFTC